MDALERLRTVIQGVLSDKVEETRLELEEQGVLRMMTDSKSLCQIAAF